MENASVWVIGIRLDPDVGMPTYYVLFIGAEQTPLLVNDQLILFSATQYFGDVAALAGIMLPTAASSDIEIEMVCDVVDALYLTENCDRDESASVLNCLNILFDLVKETGGIIPDVYRQKLSNFADHLTFNRSFSHFFQEAGLLRSDVLDGILWCIGWVMTHSCFFDIRKNQREE